MLRENWQNSPESDPLASMYCTCRPNFSTTTLLLHAHRPSPFPPPDGAAIRCVVFDTVSGIGGGPTRPRDAAPTTATTDCRRTLIGGYCDVIVLPVVGRCSAKAGVMTSHPVLAADIGSSSRRIRMTRSWSSEAIAAADPILSSSSSRDCPPSWSTWSRRRRREDDDEVRACKDQQHPIIQRARSCCSRRRRWRHVTTGNGIRKAARLCGNFVIFIASVVLSRVNAGFEKKVFCSKSNKRTTIIAAIAYQQQSVFVKLQTGTDRCRSSSMRRCIAGSWHTGASIYTLVSVLPNDNSMVGVCDELGRIVLMHCNIKTLFYSNIAAEINITKRKFLS